MSDWSEPKYSENRYEDFHNSNSLDEIIRDIAFYKFPFITEFYCVGYVEQLKSAVEKLKSDADNYLEYLTYLEKRINSNE